MNQVSEPQWLVSWRQNGLSPMDALQRFHAMPPVSIEDMTGIWTGTGLATGHVLDGVLERLGWYGKRFQSKDDVDPLLFRTRSGKTIALDPGRIPVKLAIRFTHLSLAPGVRAMFRLVQPLLRTRRPTARLRLLSRGGTPSAAMIYDRQPIIDHFRLATLDHVVGLMDARFMPQPYFFLLTRRDQAASRAP